MSQTGKWQEESSFFGKKEAKKLVSLASPPSRIVGSITGEAQKPNNAQSQLRDQSPNPTNKVFLLLFVHKKKTLPAPYLPELRP